MGYDIHIERDPPVTLTEWKSAVAATNGVRLDSSGARTTNPHTGEVISMRGADGDAQVFLDGEWLPWFRWQADGGVTFPASSGWEDSGNPIRTLARSLACRLNATLVGDEGETYD